MSDQPDSPDMATNGPEKPRTAGDNCFVEAKKRTAMKSSVQVGARFKKQAKDKYEKKTRKQRN